MKTIIYLILLSLFSKTALAQETDTANVYYLAIKSYLKDQKEIHDQRPDLYKIPETYLIESDKYSTNKLPEIIDGQKIKFLSQEDLFEKTKGKENIWILVIRPARSNNGRLEIHIIKFRVSRTKKSYSYLNSGGMSFEITGNEENKLILRQLN